HFLPEEFFLVCSFLTYWKRRWYRFRREQGFFWQFDGFLQVAEWGVETRHAQNGTWVVRRGQASRRTRSWEEAREKAGVSVQPSAIGIWQIARSLCSLYSTWPVRCAHSMARKLLPYAIKRT